MHTTQTPNSRTAAGPILDDLEHYLLGEESTGGGDIY